MSPSCPTLVITAAGTLARAFASALRLMSVWGWLTRPPDAEVIGFPPQTVRLLADSSATSGRLSTQRITLAGGANGANPRAGGQPGS